MTLYEELQARGLVAQITDNEIIDLINNGKATFYIGLPHSPARTGRSRCSVPCLFR